MCLVCFFNSGQVSLKLWIPEAMFQVIEANLASST